MAASTTSPSTVEWSIVGKVCLITGANTGIGYETALRIAQLGAAKVILACRNTTAAEEAAEQIRKQLATAAATSSSSCIISTIELDLSPLDSVRQCARKINDEHPFGDRLDVLICNAGVHAPNDRRYLTKDGFELTFATNHLGHFLLINLLTPLLRKSAPSRIVVVASDAYSFCWPRGLDIDDLNAERPGKYDAMRAYSQSKLANILHVRSLNQRLNGSGVAVFSLHPGFVRTTIARRHQSRTFLAFLEPIQKCFATTPERGADTSVYCACQPGIEQTSSGKYFKNKKVTSVWAIASDDQMAERLWQQSEQMVVNNSNSNNK